MKTLEDYTLKYVSDYIINEIVQDYGVSKKMARKLFLNALARNIVTAEIHNVVRYLLDKEEE